MLILYPSDDFATVNDVQTLEKQTFENHGVATAIFDFNEFFEEKLKLKPKISEPIFVLYRGWMLSPENYRALVKLLKQKSLTPITTPEHYQSCHYLPNWYETFADITPKTVFTSDLAQLENLYQTHFANQKVFVKDFVKSDTSSDSIAHNWQDVQTIVANIQKFRGRIDGGICLREYVALIPESEERYFVYKNQAFARDGNVPDLVNRVAKKIDSPFFSVDTCLDVNGKLWLIELGDGQVSDTKKWNVTDFVRIFL